MTDLAIETHTGSGDGVLVLGHATGFCKEVWRPVVRALRDAGVKDTVVAYDARGHGGSPALDRPVDWWVFGNDVADLLDELGKPVVGVGHSMGGAAVAMAAVLRPELIRGLVLIEPVVAPPPYVRLDDFPLAAKAERRRPGFESREAARRAYRRKALFSGWDQEAFDGYIEGGLRDATDGVELACAPDVEADVFRGSADSGIYDRASEIEAAIRLVISDAPGPGLDPAMAALPHRFRQVTTSYLSGQTHMVVMERPDLVAGEIMAHLEALRSSP